VKTITTARGTLYQQDVGGLTVTYLSGKDAGPTDPVHAMSVGEVEILNEGPRPLRVRYDSEETFFSGHRYEFGPNAEQSFEHPHAYRIDPADDLIDYPLAPGQKLMISRQDLMDVVERAGRQRIVDGVITTQYRAGIQIDDDPYVLRFGPHRFQIDMDRDWDDEEKAYLDFFARRDAGAQP
jgi:hypothetical protein